MPMRPDRKFAVFILTHGRPDRVITYNVLNRCGYTGEVFFLVDDLDESLPRYRENFGEKVIVFNKEEIARKVDMDEGFNDVGARKVVVYARNAAAVVAQELGLDYYLQLDDDYTGFRYLFTPTLEQPRPRPLVRDIDAVFDIMLDYLIRSGAATVAFPQGGDLIGGYESTYLEQVGTKRKAMNSFFASTKRPLLFHGQFNEDVNLYVLEGLRGEVFLTIFFVQLQQLTTQAHSGGMTEAYQSYGTYVKTFQTVMFAPACVQVSVMHAHYKRIHHKIRPLQTFPRIIREEYRKP